MAMSDDFLFEIDVKGDKGGLTECLEKANVADAIKAWITGNGDNDLYCETLIDFIHQCSEANFERKMKELLTKARLPSLNRERDIS